ATTCCLGVRVETDDRWRVYAPHGLSDMFNLVLRPNPTLAPRSVYETKAARWREQWPELRVMDWPATNSASVTAEGVQQRKTATTRTDPVQ
ncbi:nucleotidyltransferase family protein, partial [Streptomyces sp. NPDC004532]